MSDTFDEPYEKSAFTADFLSCEDPFSLFATWLSDAEAGEINDPNAMSLATVDGEGRANVRIVLLKGFDEKGFSFYTNLESEKGIELLANSNAAICFHWKSLRRQVRVRGPVSLVSEREADAYFASRPRGSQIGAWASRQSQELSSRAELTDLVDDLSEKFGEGEIKRPDHWSGYLITPLMIEFWHDRPFRLHDRLQFKRSDGNSDFEKIQLFP